MIGNERYQCLAHLTNDAEQKTSQSGSFTVFSVAVNRKLKDKEITKFISCIKAAITASYFHTLKKERMYYSKVALTVMLMFQKKEYQNFPCN